MREKLLVAAVWFGGLVGAWALVYGIGWAFWHQPREAVAVTAFFVACWAVRADAREERESKTSRDDATPNGGRLVIATERATLRQLIDQRKRERLEQERRDAPVWACDWCHSTFEKRQDTQRFCSPSCRRSWNDKTEKGIAARRVRKQRRRANVGRTG